MRIRKAHIIGTNYLVILKKAPDALVVACFELKCVLDSTSCTLTLIIVAIDMVLDHDVHEGPAPPNYGGGNPHSG